jgi:hypothetical protein
MLRARAIDWQEARVMKSVKSLSAAFASSIACAALLLWTPTGFAQPQKQTDRVDKMSSAGKRAAAAVNKIAKESAPEARTALAVTEDDEDRCINEPDCEGEEEGDAEEAPGGQAEVSIAVDATGQHIVIGYNDTRGFSENPISLSGVLYSEDGGKTFVDGGRLPTPGTDVIGTTRLPQVFGDPEVKYLGACTFVYSSIMIKKFSATTAVQTMSLHRSTDCGKTWQGPFEITAATNPNGIVEEDEPADAADKEFMDVDPDTGRLIISWSNFTPAAPGGVEIRTSFSDNAKSGSPPTWSTGTIVAATADDGQSSCPRFAAGNNNAYVAWRRFPFPGTFGGLGNTIGFARSLNNGATWQAPVNTSNEFFTMDQVLGNDRVNTSPSLAVDNSYGKYRGNIYLVYANNNSGDGADIVFQRSTDKGVTFSAPLELNAGPGEDRPQWFPWVTVDTTTGRVHVFYYDQGIDTSGDLTEVSYLFSDDGGKHWSAPVPLTKRPFHAGHGNDTGQPNLGDYNQAVAQHGDLFASYALASPPPGGFVDGQPTSTQLTVPDVEFKRHSQGSKLDLAAAEHRRQRRLVQRCQRQRQRLCGSWRDDPRESLAGELHCQSAERRHCARRDRIAAIRHTRRASPATARRLRQHLVRAVQGKRAVVSAATGADVRSWHRDRVAARSARPVRRLARRCDVASHAAHRHARGDHGFERELRFSRTGHTARRLDVCARRRRECRAVGDEQYVLQQQQRGVPCQRE